MRDTFLHYFGCLRNSQREAYFKTLPQHEKDRIEAETSRIAAQRAYFEGGDETKGMVVRLKRYLHTRFPSLPDRENPLPIPTWPTKDNAFGLSAYMIFFKKSEPFTDTHYPDQYPNQRIAVKDLLDKNVKTNPLMQECGDDEIRYFHLPGNNMEWIEVSMHSCLWPVLILSQEAMARYYHEERPDYDGLFRRPENPSKTYMLLRPEFWRGQQHGGRHDAIHARHMRPRCDIISTGNCSDCPYLSGGCIFDNSHRPRKS